MSGSRPTNQNPNAHPNPEDGSRPASSGPRRSGVPTNTTNPAPTLTKTKLPRGLKPVPASSIPVPTKPPLVTPILTGGRGESTASHVHNQSFEKPTSSGCGGSDLEPCRIPYRTTSPLFTVKSDAELDKNLEMAFEQSMHMRDVPMDIDNGNGKSGVGIEIQVCEGFPLQWKNFLEQNLLCDCVIQSNDGQSFRAHRCILAANCPYLHQQFCSGVKPTSALGTSEGPQKIQFKLVDSTSLRCIIDFAYTGTFNKDIPSIQKLLPIANRFKMIPVMQQCCAYLIETMTPENVLHIYSFARPYFCSKLESKAKSYILNNFRFVLKTQEFLELDAAQLKAFLKDDHLNARNEAMVFEAIRSWVDHNPQKRQKNISDLLGCVRFGLMSYGYFTNVVYQWHFVNEDESVRQALYAPSILLTSIDSLNNTEVDLNDPLARPRIPYEVIFAVGGWSAGSPTAFMETYDVRADRWFLLNNTDSSPRAYHGLVALGHYIYMIGGFDGNEHFNTVKRYDPMLKIWEQKSCMLNARCYISCCELDGIIYACGGYNGRTRMCSAEKYTPELNQWELITPMNRQRSDASAAALKGKVYVAGGFTGSEVLNSVETYDPKENQWTFIQPMNTARSGVSLVSYRDSLYAIGGFNGFNRLNTAERYDPDEPGPWKIIPEMSSARSNFAAVCADELLICIGGFNGATTIPYVECYDSKVNEWFDASHMNLNRSALSACVVTNMPKAREYSYLHRIQELLGIPSDQDAMME